jgi:hypothetical protein
MNEPNVFRNRRLPREDFRGPDWSGHDFTGSVLFCAKFQSCVMKRSLFMKADLQGANFSEAVCTESDFSGADFTDAIWITATFGTVFLVGLSFQRLQFCVPIFLALRSSRQISGFRIYQEQIFLAAVLWTRFSHSRPCGQIVSVTCSPEEKSHGVCNNS